MMTTVWKPGECGQNSTHCDQVECCIARPPCSRGKSPPPRRRHRRPRRGVQVDQRRHGPRRHASVTGHCAIARGVAGVDVEHRDRKRPGHAPVERRPCQGVRSRLVGRHKVNQPRARCSARSRCGGHRGVGRCPGGVKRAGEDGDVDHADLGTCSVSVRRRVEGSTLCPKRLGATPGGETKEHSSRRAGTERPPCSLSDGRKFQKREQECRSPPPCRLRRRVEADQRRC
mmetsp:Transcript_6846/g.15164  ORF Transcript_6846/g.15164 Transcript_6846/m.15164 type:complete len:229 (+) Transcript_6846:1008-1694(+)